MATSTGYELFPGGVGNMQKDAARFASRLDDVESKIFATLPDATWVYPGHGDDTTLGTEPSGANAAGSHSDLARPSSCL